MISVPFTATDLVAATRRANDHPMFPLVEDAETASVLHASVQPAMNALSPHLRFNEDVRLALMTTFMMGVSAGLELRSGS
jgi:hypothetical protein